MNLILGTAKAACVGRMYRSKKKRKKKKEVIGKKDARKLESRGGGGDGRLLRVASMSFLVKWFVAHLTKIQVSSPEAAKRRKGETRRSRSWHRRLSMEQLTTDTWNELICLFLNELKTSRDCLARREHMIPKRMRGKLLYPDLSVHRGLSVYMSSNLSIYQSENILLYSALFI